MMLNKIQIKHTLTQNTTHICLEVALFVRSVSALAAEEATLAVEMEDDRGE